MDNALRKELIAIVDGRLAELLAVKTPALLWESMAYSVRAGGKRLRPVLHLLAAKLKSADIAQNIDIACAIEMIHTYSLIHDDLPALDNDTLRRGMATNHVMFGEAQAILAGDGLLNFAYETMLANARRYRDNISAHVLALSEVSKAAGVRGMIAGQVEDVRLEGKDAAFDELSYIHRHKTADMIVGALRSGIILYDPSRQEMDAITKYGENIGLVFQIVDDVLDVTADVSLGKTLGKDAKSGKTTYASLYGIERSMQIAREKTDEAMDALHVFGGAAEELRNIAKEMLARKK